MYTAATRNVITNKFTHNESKSVLNAIPNMRLNDTTFCDKSGVCATLGTTIFSFGLDLKLISSNKPSNHKDQEDLYYYYSNDFNDMSLEDFNHAIGHEKIDGFDDHDPRYRQSVPGAHDPSGDLHAFTEQCKEEGYNSGWNFNMNDVNKVYDVFTREKVCMTRFQKTRFVRTRTGMKSRGIMIVEPIIDNVVWSDDQKQLLKNIAKDNGWWLVYFHESPDGYDDRQAGMIGEVARDEIVRHDSPCEQGERNGESHDGYLTREMVGEMGSLGDYIELVHKGLD